MEDGLEEGNIRGRKTGEEAVLSHHGDLNRAMVVHGANRSVAVQEVEEPNLVMLGVCKKRKE
jgi:hypothetical protein